MADPKIQWHPGFYAGIELELSAYDLDYDQEHQVTRGALSFDLLIIKKQTDKIIDNEIGLFPYAADCNRRAETRASFTLARAVQTGYAG